MIPHTSQLTAFEPSWATRYTEAELRGLLVLATLFNEKVYVHDTQLVDHTTLLTSFLRRADDDATLFHLLHGLIKEGIIRVCLRKSVYVRSLDMELPVRSMTRLHEILSARSESGWVPPRHYGDRASMMSYFDQTLDDAVPLPYNYMDIKKVYIDAVRIASVRADTEHYRLLAAMPADFRTHYEGLLAREWFSFIDIIDLCAQFGIRQESELIQSHGLIDEICYAEWNKLRLLASNSKTWLTEKDVSPVDHGPVIPIGEPITYIGARPSLHSAFQESMLAEIESPGLALIGTLSLQDICALREQGKDIFRLRVLQSDDSQQIQRRFAEALLSYWDRICIHIRKTRPYLATEQTRIAIFLRRHLPTLSQWGNSAATFTLDIALDVLGKFAPGLTLSDSLRTSLKDVLSFRFLFYGDSQELKALKASVPDESWLLSLNRRATKP